VERRHRPDDAGFDVHRSVPKRSAVLVSLTRCCSLVRALRASATLPGAMHRTSFDRFARTIVSAALASLTPGCGDGDDDGPVDMEGMKPPICHSVNVQRFIEIAPALEVDSLQLVRIEDPSAPVVEVVDVYGTWCATAVDGEACISAVNAAIAPTSETATLPLEGFRLGDCVDFCPDWYLVTTRQDEVTVIRDKAGILALLGDIDTPAEAFLVAALQQYTVGCDADRYGVRAVDGGYEVAATRLTSVCEPIETTQYLLSVKADASLGVLDESVIDSNSGCVGRRPAFLRRDPGCGRTEVGARLASLAQLEAASIPAFAKLSRELRDLAAPCSLRRAARRARVDEVRHARQMRCHARRFGGAPQPPHAPPMAPRSRLAFAIENAREGCVREAYGAVVARFQARRAGDTSLRRALDRIARDEAQHASLAMRVDAWAKSGLDDHERMAVEQARRAALDELRVQVLADDPGPDVAAVLGLPRPSEASALFDAFERASDAIGATARQRVSRAASGS